MAGVALAIAVFVVWSLAQACKEDAAYQGGMPAQPIDSPPAARVAGAL